MEVLWELCSVNMDRVAIYTPENREFISTKNFVNSHNVKVPPLENYKPYVISILLAEGWEPFAVLGSIGHSEDFFRRKISINI